MVSPWLSLESPMFGQLSVLSLPLKHRLITVLSRKASSPSWHPFVSITQKTSMTISWRRFGSRAEKQRCTLMPRSVVSLSTSKMMSFVWRLASDSNFVTHQRNSRETAFVVDALFLIVVFNRWYYLISVVIKRCTTSELLNQFIIIIYIYILVEGKRGGTTSDD